ncbi:MAG: hypothetical protein NWE96_07540 [Candidatus Bathyarchaeota archaeon]|nr:hypothetical protein [Candidatus Bathyarchaeota archaeon]
MKAKILCFSMIFLFLSSSFNVVTAQSSVGVSSGDTFTYTVTSNSNIPLIYQVLNTPKEVQTLTITIKSLNANIVTLNMTQTFKNGTRTSLLQEKDLRSPSGFPITFANLNIGDQIWTSDLLSPKVNDSAIVSFLGGARQINHASIGPSETGYELVDYYFDRKTGMPTQIRYVESNQVSTTLTLENSTVWVIPEFSSTFPFLLLIAFVSVCIVLRGKLKNSGNKFVFFR